MKNKIIFKINNLRRGLLELAILMMINKAKPSFSKKEIEKVLDNTALSTTKGALCGILSRLRKEGLVTNNFEESEIGYGRKYYYLTPRGEETVEILTKQWHKITQNMSDFETIDQNIKLYDEQH